MTYTKTQAISQVGIIDLADELYDLQAELAVKLDSFLLEYSNRLSPQDAKRLNYARRKALRSKAELQRVVLDRRRCVTRSIQVHNTDAATFSKAMQGLYVCSKRTQRRALLALYAAKASNSFELSGQLHAISQQHKDLEVTLQAVNEGFYCCA